VVAREGDHANLTSELRDSMRERLPEYMVPAYFVILDQMPLTANGKIDRARLPLPDQAQLDNRKPFVAPRTPLEEMLAGIWSEQLNVARVGVEDNFFDLGGHSLLAMQLISQLHELFRVELPLRSIFAAPTVTQMAAEMIARETKPGQVEKIAAALKRIKSMSADDVSEILQEKKRVSNS
jgi:acyl carrier protein